MLDELLKERNLPSLLSTAEMLDILFENEYGYMPPNPTDISFEKEEKYIKSFCAGKAVANKITAKTVVNGKEFSFPFIESVPTKKGPHPFFVLINFRDDVPDLYLPVEELIDNGFAVLSFCYKDVTSDDGDFTNGLAGVLYNDGKRRANDAGKIAMWSWAAQRVMDYAASHPDVFDLDRSVVCGHSRLGKTALLTGAVDERFKFTYSNDSGCSGAAVTRNKVGETVADITTRFPFWFCENYKRYAENVAEMPFEQHYLLASVAPRFVLVGSADEDKWADPDSEFLCCVAASPAFKKGFNCPDRLPQIDDCFFDGDVGYHLRAGKHYFSRQDWQRLIAFVNLHTKKEK